MSKVSLESGIVKEEKSHRQAPAPALGRAGCSPCCSTPQASIIVNEVIHDYLGGHVNGENQGQFPDARLYPASVVIKVLSCSHVLPAQKSPTNTAVDNVVNGVSDEKTRDERGRIMVVTST